jgi:hypothetical protein
MPDEGIVVVAEYAGEMEARVAQLVLEANEIPTVLLRDDAGGMLPMLHVILPIRLAVHESDFELAQRLLEDPDSFENDASAGDGDDYEDRAGWQEADDDVSPAD